MPAGKTTSRKLPAIPLKPPVADVVKPTEYSVFAPAAVEGGEIDNDAPVTGRTPVTV